MKRLKSDMIDMLIMAKFPVLVDSKILLIFYFSSLLSRIFPVRMPTLSHYQKLFRQLSLKSIKQGWPGPMKNTAFELRL